jgi:hypothetical protein
MSVKTDNNATADIIGPAKLTFQKSNNQLIVDIAYSDHVDIKNSTILSESKDQDILIVKTDNKTIVAKTDVIDISLNNLGSQQMIKNNAGEISITSLSDNSVLALKSNESVLLNEEKTLFALEDKKNITLNEKENTVSKSDEAKEAQLIEITLETTILNE